MKIFIELGNTSIKVAVSINGIYKLLGSVKHHAKVSESLNETFDIDTDEVSQVYVCSVANVSINAELTQYIHQTFQVYPTFLATQPESCGIKCGYERFENFGVDRWMAIIGACGHTSQPTIIVDAGTALTIDVVVDKQHQGGFIVPGLGVLRESLFENTAIPRSSMTLDEIPEGLLAKDTDNAIMGGTLYMLSAFINTLLENLETETGRRFRCIGTGGDFETLKPMLDNQFEVIDDLTLLGMVEIIQSC